MLITTNSINILTLTISCWEWTRFSVIQGDNVERRDTKRIIIIFSQILNAVGVVQSGFYYSVVSLICIHNYCSLVYWLECKAAWEPLLQQKSFWLSQFLVEDGIQGDNIEMSSRRSFSNSNSEWSLHGSTFYYGGSCL